jgi:hypothetical protein
LQWTFPNLLPLLLPQHFCLCSAIFREIIHVRHWELPLALHLCCIHVQVFRVLKQW